MNSTNPYKPSIDAPTSQPRYTVADGWNAIVGALIALLTVVGCFGIQHFQQRAFAGEYSRWISAEIFLREVCASLGPLTAVAMFLLAITTFTFEKHSHRWRVLYGSMILILTFDFYSMTFTSSAFLRSCIFFVLYVPVLFGGYGWPRALRQSIAFVKRGFE